MEYTPTLRNFGPAPTADEVSALLEKIGPQARRNCRTEVYKRCFGCIDLTSLGATDSRRSIGEFTRKAIELPRHFPEAGSVASICVYPVFVETVWPPAIPKWRSPACRGDSLPRRPTWR